MCSPRARRPIRFPIARAMLLVTAACLACARVNGAAAATAVQVTAGDGRTCVRTSSGDLRCWGDGPVGDGSELRRLVPVDLTDLAASTAFVDLGHHHGCAVTTAGGAVCWGVNTQGQLGDGTTTIRLAPVAVSGLPSGVSAVGMGRNHTCAVMSTGAVKCWGDNHAGQLGDGTTDDALAPVDVVGLGTPVASVAGTFSRTCALTTGGGVKCWGDLPGGSNSPTPVDVAGLTSGVAAMAVADGHLCVLTTAGGVKCMGQNPFGQLGDGTFDDSPTTPVDVLGLASGVIAIDATSSHTCAVLASGGVRCWGRNDRGQLGDGVVFGPNHPTPVDVVGADGMARVATGLEHTCAVAADGAVRCWGSSSGASIGNGDAFSYVFIAQNVIDFGPPACTIVDTGQYLGVTPKPRLNVTRGRYDGAVDTLTANGEFALPPGVVFADLDPAAGGARLELRNGLGRVVTDLRLQGGLLDPVRKRGWKTNQGGTSWTFLNTSGQIRRLQISDRSPGVPGGRVRFTVNVRFGYVPVAPGDEPLQISLTLGDDDAGDAGHCGASTFVAADCTFNEPGTRVQCKR